MKRSPQRVGLILLTTSLVMALAQFAQAQSTISASDVARLKAFIGSTGLKAQRLLLIPLAVGPSSRVFIPSVQVTH